MEMHEISIPYENKKMFLTKQVITQYFIKQRKKFEMEAGIIFQGFQRGEEQVCLK